MKQCDAEFLAAVSNEFAASFAYLLVDTPWIDSPGELVAAYADEAAADAALADLIARGHRFVQVVVLPLNPPAPPIITGGGTNWPDVTDGRPTAYVDGEPPARPDE